MLRPGPPLLTLASALLCSVSGIASAGPAEELRSFVGGKQARLVAVDRAAGGKILLLDTEKGGSPALLLRDEIAQARDYPSACAREGRCRK